MMVSFSFYVPIAIGLKGMKKKSYLKMDKRVFSILLPTWNNPQFLDPCMRSISDTGQIGPAGLGEVIIINNGKQPCKEQYKDWPCVKVIEPGENLGWEGGLKLGLQHTDAKFVCFQNDDTFIPHSSFHFYQKLLIPFQDKSVGAVGPATTVAAGMQSVYHPNHPFIMHQEVKWLIFFTVMLRREYLDAVGGIDAMLPGGDDFDLSIRLRNDGKKLLIAPMAFLIHHAFKTGERVHGNHQVDGGWNSPQMQERTNKALIQKHGFKTFIETMYNQPVDKFSIETVDTEGTVISKLISPTDKVLELACGFRRTVPQAITVDRIAKDELSMTRSVEEKACVADIQADITGDIPTGNDYDVIIARHIIEHILDTPAVIKNWSKHLKPGGRLIIATPNENMTEGIPLNPEHCHAFTPESLKSIVELLGFREVAVYDPNNKVSFISVFEKQPIVSDVLYFFNGLDRMYEGDISTIPTETSVI